MCVCVCVSVEVNVLENLFKLQSLGPLLSKILNRWVEGGEAVNLHFHICALGDSEADV